MAAVDDRAGTEEEQRLEERMGDQVEHAHRHTAHAQPHHHVAKLGNRGISQNAFDIVLRHRDARGEDGGNRANPGHHR